MCRADRDHEALCRQQAKYSETWVDAQIRSLLHAKCRAEEERVHLRQQQAEVERKLEAAAKLEAEARAEAKHAAQRGAEQERALAQQADHLRRQEADLVSCNF